MEKDIRIISAHVLNENEDVKLL